MWDSFHGSTLGARLEMEELFCHKNYTSPPALSDGGNLHLGTKSDLLIWKISVRPKQRLLWQVMSLLMEQILKPAAVPLKFSSLATSQCVMFGHRYIEDSLKDTARAKRVRRRVVAEGLIPGNWRNFLRVDKNKTKLLVQGSVRGIQPRGDVVNQVSAA